MIASLRKAASSIVAKFLIALLVLSFAAWGIGDWLRGASYGAVAQVGDEEISIPQFQREFNMALRQFNGQITAEQARMLQLDQSVLTQMAARIALDQETAALGIDAPNDAVDDYIRNAAAFQNPAGDFDRNAFEYAMRQAGLRPEEFQDGVRRDLARLTLVETIEAGGAYPQSAAETVWRHVNETRNLDYLYLNFDDVDAPTAPSDSALKSFHEAEADRFTAPEYRKIRYLWLRAEERAEPELVSDEEIAEAFERRRDEFQSPERRNIEQIVFSDEETAKTAAGRVLDGETFEQVAAGQGLTPADIALGYVTRDDLFDEASAEAVFGETSAGLIGPVQTDFGWSLFNIEGVIDAVETTLEEASEQLRADVAVERARAALPDLANAVEDARAGGAGLIEIGRQEEATAGQVIVDAQGFGPDGAPVADLPSDPSFLQQAFSLEVGEEIDLIELPDLEYFAVDIVEITDPALRPFEEVRTEVEAAWLENEQITALEALATDLAQRLDSGGDIAEIASEIDAEPLRFEGLGRSGAAGDLSPEAVSAAFETEIGRAFQAPIDRGLRRLVARVDAAVEPDTDARSDEIALIADRAGVDVAGDILALFQAAALADRAFVPNPQAIDLALNPGGYGGGHGGM